MLSQRWWWTPYTRLVLTELHRRRDKLHRTTSRMLYFCHHAPGLHMLVLERVFDIVDRCIWHSRVLEDRQPFFRLLCVRCLLDHGFQFLPVLHSHIVGFEFGICFPFWL